jgi:sigma-70-like protein
MPHRVFEEVVLPHLDAAFNYARWLTKSDADAEDVVQDAVVRALRFSHPYGMTTPVRGCSPSCPKRGTRAFRRSATPINTQSLMT